MNVSEELKLGRIVNADEDVVKLGHTYITGGNIKWYSHSGKIVWQFP